VTIPSGEVKLVQQFTVPSSGATNILLDFDGDRSVQSQGNGTYSMKPVITVASVS
jgi:PKD repeat protein